MSLELKYPKALALRKKLLDCIQKRQAGALDETRLGLHEVMWIDLYKELEALLNRASEAEGVEVG